MASLLILAKTLWQNRTLVLAIISLLLALLLIGASDRIYKLNAKIAAKPAIIEKTVTKIQVVRVAGPVKVMERITMPLGGGRIIERETIRGPVTTETDRDISRERMEVPMRPGQPTRWVVGYAIDVYEPRRLGIVRAGITLLRTIDLTYGYEQRFNIHRADVAFRF